MQQLKHVLLVLYQLLEQLQELLVNWLEHQLAQSHQLEQLQLLHVYPHISSIQEHVYHVLMEPPLAQLPLQEFQIVKLVPQPLQHKVQPTLSLVQVVLLVIHCIQLPQKVIQVLVLQQLVNQLHFASIPLQDIPQVHQQLHQDLLSQQPTSLKSKLLLDAQQFY